MGKIQDLYYLLTRGKDAPKPWEHGPSKVLADKCGCGKECGCNSVESLERSAGLDKKKVSIKVVPATVDATATSIPKDVHDHLVEEGHIKPVKSRVVKADPKTSPTPIVKELNKKAAAPKKPAAKATDTSAPVAKKKPAPKKK